MAKARTTHGDLRQTLTARRREMQKDVRGRIRDGWTDQAGGVHDAIDTSDANFQQAIDMTLLQIKATALTHMDEALGRLDAGQYGSCVECTGKISEERLRALPFAVRCLACEAKREHDQGRLHQVGPRDASPFSHVTS